MYIDVDTLADNSGWVVYIQDHSVKRWQTTVTDARGLLNAVKYFQNKGYRCYSKEDVNRIQNIINTYWEKKSGAS